MKTNSTEREIVNIFWRVAVPNPNWSILLQTLICFKLNYNLLKYNQWRDKNCFDCWNKTDMAVMHLSSKKSLKNLEDEIKSEESASIAKR